MYAPNDPVAGCPDLRVAADAAAELLRATTAGSSVPGIGAELTLFIKSGGPLTKRIALDAAGRVASDGSACVMAEGRAERMRLAGPADLAAALGTMPPDRAIALGRLRADLPDTVPVVTRRRLGEAPAGAIARTRDHIDYVPGEPAFVLIDFDRKGMPEAVAETLAAHGGFWPAVVAAVPALASVARVRRASTSAGLIDLRIGAPAGLGVGGGEHVYLLVRDGADAERFLRALHDRSWLHGLGWFLVGAAGQLLERSVVDRVVGAPERLVFEGAPVLEPPLGQHRAARAPAWVDGEALDTRAACPSLTRVERAMAAELKDAARAALALEAGRVRAAADDAFVRHLAERHGVPPATALRVAEARHRGVLLPHVELAFDDGEIGAATVAEVLREPGRFVGETLADPLEGVAYGRCKAMVIRRESGSLWIHSFAHGRTAYDLQLDAAALEAALRGAEPHAVVDTYVRLLPEAALEPDEDARLTELVRELSGVKARPLAGRVRAARQRRAAREAEERRWAAAEARANDGACLGGHRRVRLPAPLPDDERTPVLLALDEALGAAPDPEPPMRSADGIVTEVRARRPWGLHGLTGAGADAAEAPEDRLPASEEPLITPLDPAGLGLLAERHVEHYRTEKDGQERAVSLPEPFLRAYLGWRGSALPTVRAVVTAPLVTREGGLLAGAGLDRAREVVFRIEPQLLALVPADPDAIADAEAVEALRFLVDEWLCDVATGFVGRVVLLAYALTIIERVLLPERPAFFVTAGQRGGGKTTVVAMVVAAVLGRRPPAGAWSPSAEERRKALLAYLGEGVATLVWDNIERGTTISCPSIEKALTAAEFTDRVLGVSRSATVPATTVQAFTGNNIAPWGDMASRSLVCRLEVERPDPENRAFRHPDPVGWTLSNRARILRALYTLLRWNPQVRAPASERHPSKTRFKTWWDLVGAPLELAAMLACEAQAAAAEVPGQAGGGLFRCAPEAVDFGALFAAGEVEDEETAGMRELVLLLREAFGDRLFSAADLTALALAPAAAVAAAPHLGGPRDDFERRAVEAMERAQALRAALEGATGKALPPGAAVTARLVGKRLQMVVGRPVALGGGETGTVARARPGHEAHAYRVAIALASGSP